MKGKKLKVRNLHVRKKEGVVLSFDYHESIKIELKIRPTYECRFDERLKLKLRNLHVSYTLLFGLL